MITAVTATKPAQFSLIPVSIEFTDQYLYTELWLQYLAHKCRESLRLARSLSCEFLL